MGLQDSCDEFRRVANRVFAVHDVERYHNLTRTQHRLDRVVLVAVVIYLRLSWYFTTCSC